MVKTTYNISSVELLTDIKGGMWLVSAIINIMSVTHSQKWWVICSFAYLRWRRRDICNFHMIYIDDIIHNCMCVIFWTWKWYIESSGIKWNKNEWKQLNIRGSCTKWKSEATNPYLALRVYVKMSEIHETGGVWHNI
jgi:hypothetical protein